MHQNNSLEAILIIGYRRAKNLSNLIDQCLSSGISRIYVSIDAAPNLNKLAKTENIACREIAESYKVLFPNRIFLRFSSLNSGCAVAVISSCDWFFSREKFGAVLEDDCFPSQDFFRYVSEMRGVLESDSNIWLISGNQLAPFSEVENGVLLSRYALIWGWATSDTKWTEITESLRASVRDYSSRKNYSVEDSFWYYGAQRAEDGFVDAWDTILLHRMRVLGKLAIHPTQNLITNVGFDSRATHTYGNNLVKQQLAGDFLAANVLSKLNLEMENYLKVSVYQIRNYRFLTNRIRRFLDLSKRVLPCQNIIPLHSRLLHKKTTDL